MTDKTAEEQRKEDFKKESDAKSKVIDFIHNWLWSSPDRATEGPIPREWIGDTSRMIKEYAESYAQQRVASLEEENEYNKRCAKMLSSMVSGLNDRIQQLEELLKAADEVIDLAECPESTEDERAYWTALEKYNALKEK